MRAPRMTAMLALAIIDTTFSLATGAAKPAGDALLRQAFDFAAPRTRDVQSFEMETVVLTYEPDGKRVNTDILRLGLKCTPGKAAGQDADQYTCTRFTVQFGNAPEVAIPAVENWTYSFGNTPTGVDEKGQVFGIDHAKFEKLLDANGQPLPPDKAYYVYNTFIDFHGFCNAFAEPTTEGKGIQDLKHIGDRIIHAASFTEPPVNLGSNIEKGSTFKNGEVTLELKGISLVDEATCAIVAYDSGQSSFQMLMKPMPNMEVRSVGASHYKGDLYIDLATRWPRKVTMDELVVAESTVPMLPNKINAVIERNTVIRTVRPAAAK